MNVVVPKIRCCEIEKGLVEFIDTNSGDEIPGLVPFEPNWKETCKPSHPGLVHTWRYRL